MILFLLIRQEERQLASAGHLTCRGEINPFVGAYIKVVFLYFFWIGPLKTSSIGRCWNPGIFSTQKSNGFV